MVRYTAEQKAQALESIKSIGVTKASEELNISKQTLYKWNTEAKADQPPAASKTRKPRKKLAAKAEKSEGKMKLVDQSELQALLSNDDLLEKINQLENENRSLRTTNVKLKQMIANFIA